MDIIKERLAYAMEMHGFSARALSRVSGVSSWSINQYVKTGKSPKMEQIIAMAEALHVSPEYLLGIDDDHTTYYLQTEIIKEVREMDEHRLKILKAYIDLLKGEPND